MRHITCIVLAILFVGIPETVCQTTLTGSSGEVKTFSYELLVEAPIYECDILGNQLDSTVVVAPHGAVFMKVDTKGDNLIIRFWLWHKDEDRMHKLNYTDSAQVERRYFLLSLDEFDAKAIPKHSLKPTFSVGSTVIPLRIRPSPFDFSSEFSFGTSFGARFRLSAYQDISLNAVFGLHITNATLDSLDTEGAVSSSTTFNQSALTPAVGVVFEFSRAQVGFYLGWDLISGQFKDDWIYQGKTWFSIGVGASLFSFQNTAAGGNSNQNQPN